MTHRPRLWISSSPDPAFDIFCNAIGGYSVFHFHERPSANLSSAVSCELMVQGKQGKCCRILIVENNDDGHGGLTKELAALGHTVVSASARDEAIARQDLDQFDLLVTD